MTTSPVLLIVFNRPDTTAEVLKSLRRARPPALYIAGDGPRPDRAGEAERCAETRRIATSIDWPCEVKTYFRDNNIGCGEAVSAAITWFFNEVPEGIILEDDTVPSPAFFHFCDRMLQTYRSDPRVFMISGYNQVPRGSSRQGHFLSRYGAIWGWAGWADRWQSYELRIPGFEEEFAKACAAGWIRRWEAEHWRHRINVSRLNNSSWDDQWYFVILKNDGRCVRPTVNLVANIGFGHPEAVHHAASSPSFPKPACKTADPAQLVRPTAVRPFEDKNLFVYEIKKRRMSASDCLGWILPPSFVGSLRSAVSGRSVPVLVRRPRPRGRGRP
jgi:hypothetical protein